MSRPQLISWLITLTLAPMLSVAGLGINGAYAQQPTDQEFCDGRRPSTPDDRIRSCTRVIDSSEVDARSKAAAYTNRGAAHFGKRDFDRAFADYNQAIVTDPKLALAYYNRAVSYADRQDTDRAIADYNQAIAVDPRYAMAYNNRGTLYYAKGDFDRAMTDFSQALAIDSNFAMAYSNRGNAYYARRDLDRAIADFNRAVAIEPKFAGAYNNRANAFNAAGDLDRAIADYSQAIALDPGLAKAYWNRGRLALLTGSLAKALDDLNHVAELAPTDPYVALWLDIANRRGNRPSRLAGMAKQINLTVWPSPVINLYLGQSTPDAVLASADTANAETKKDRLCDASFYIAEFVLQQGRKAEAVRLFRRAAADCRKTFIEYGAAIAELKALGEAL